ncbi:hypothetical protein [Alienimonas sp. DA493]|uniref:hypothetical protein n=1 Tax=Alienimonas sp. DA493 TaxID=3373605 RepID=UPI003754C0E0
MADAELDAELKRNAADLLAWVRERAEAGEDFLAEQAPLVVEEYLRWGWWEAALSSGLYGAGLAVAACVAWVIAPVIKKLLNTPILEQKESDFSTALLGGMFALIVGLPSALCLTSALFELVQITVAPRVWLIERLADLAS